MLRCRLSGISRALARKGADIVFFPSKISKKGIEPWHMYVQVRALENRIPVRSAKCL